MRRHQGWLWEGQIEVARGHRLLWGGCRRGEERKTVVEGELGSGEVHEGEGITGRVPLEAGKVGAEVVHIWVLHMRGKRRELWKNGYGKSLSRNMCLKPH